MRLSCKRVGFSTQEPSGRHQKLASLSVGSQCSIRFLVAIGLRYLRAKRRNELISFISMASILGIALVSDCLDITTLAVMSGFQKEIRDRLLQMAAHATVSAQGAPMHDWQHAVALAMTDLLRRWCCAVHRE